MSKKKDTLRDLDEFLKQQAASLVAPNKLSDKIEDSNPASVNLKEAEAEIKSDLSSEQIIQYLNTLSKKDEDFFRQTLYHLILTSLEFQKGISSEDSMLINTILYLKNRNNWKEAIKEYWSKR